MRTFTFVLLLAGAAAAEKTVVLLPIEARAGALSAADAEGLTEQIRSVAAETLGPRGYQIVAGQGGDAATALESAGADLALLGRAGRMEGATVIALSAYRPRSGSPASTVRVMGIGPLQLAGEVRAKLPNLLESALGLAPVAAEPTLPRGTLRIPGGSPATPPAHVENAPAAPAATAPPRAAPPPPPGEDPLVTMIRETTSEVEQIRGLRRKQNLKVQILDEKLFSKAVREKAQKELTPPVVAAERARWLAFNLAPAAADPAQILLDVLDEQIAGFYDTFTRQLIVRKDPPPSAGGMGSDGLRVILAHEIEHALQDQNFGIPDLAALPDDDVRLARSALYEGDAMAVMTAFAARRAQKPVKSAIASGAAMLRSLDSQTLLRVSGRSPELLHAPPVIREELVVPYAGGFALVAEAYRRGGFPLVDKMFRNPPSSVHQVLHPDAYFAGEAPVAVPLPPPPPGTRVIATGRMGELGTRLALETCVDKEVVKDLVPHWAGDAYTIVEGRKGALSLLWTTAWTGGAASTASNVMKLMQPCWEDPSTSGPNPLGWSIAAAARSGGSEAVVAVARGSIDLAAAVVKQLATRVVTPRSAPPVGNAAPPPSVPPTRIEDGRFVSARLALSGDVPEGYDADSSNPVTELAIKKNGAGGATLSFVPEALAGESLDAFFQAASAQIAAAQGGHLTFLGKERRTLAGAPAEERSWEVENAGLQLRIAVAPFCAGKAALTVLRLESGITSHATLEKFLGSIKATGASPACAELEE
ncbi:MAG TPA: hypothetical protein VFA79_21600 [Myxococcales bacterium]|nr:hypothetical protein [Myxococcales bacterium]